MLRELRLFKRASEKASDNEGMQSEKCTVKQDPARRLQFFLSRLRVRRGTHPIAHLPSKLRKDAGGSDNDASQEQFGTSKIGAAQTFRENRLIPAGPTFPSFATMSYTSFREARTG
jgi:hypothetical protein